MAVLEFRRVSKVRPEEDHARLDHVSFSVEKAEWNLFLCDDAHARDLVPRLFAGLVRASDGTVWIGTRDAWRTERVTGRSVGFILPWQIFPARLTLLELLTTYRTLRHLQHQHPVPQSELKRMLTDQGLGTEQTAASLSSDEHLLFQCVLAHTHHPSIYIIQGLSDVKNGAISEKIQAFLHARHDEGHTLMVVDHTYPDASMRPDRMQVVLGARLVLNVAGEAVSGAPLESGMQLEHVDRAALTDQCLAYQREVDKTALQDLPPEHQEPVDEPIEPPSARHQKLKWPGETKDS